MYIYNITGTHRRSRSITSVSFQKLGPFSQNFPSIFFLVFSKNNAGTKKQLAQNEEFQMADITRGTPFFIRSKGESAIPFNRHPTYQIETSEFAPKGCPNRC